MHIIYVKSLVNPTCPGMEAKYKDASPRSMIVARQLASRLLSLYLYL